LGRLEYPPKKTVSFPNPEKPGGQKKQNKKNNPGFSRGRSPGGKDKFQTGGGIFFQFWGAAPQKPGPQEKGGFRRAFTTSERCFRDFPPNKRFFSFRLVSTVGKWRGPGQPYLSGKKGPDEGHVWGLELSIPGGGTFLPVLSEPPKKPKTDARAVFSARASGPNNFRGGGGRFLFFQNSFTKGGKTPRGKPGGKKIGNTPPGVEKNHSGAGTTGGPLTNWAVSGAFEGVQKIPSGQFTSSPMFRTPWIGKGRGPSFFFIRGRDYSHRIPRRDPLTWGA